MTAPRRWTVVALGVALLVAAPVVRHMVPASDAVVSAPALLHSIDRSRARPFTGLVDTVGNVGLPANDELSGLSKLVGDSNRLRVWWRDPTTWRVATLRTTGETDLLHAGDRTVRWVYESKNVTMIPDVPVRLPYTSDLLPNQLARRVLSGARPDELSRIGARTVAGRDALGLRLVPRDAQAAIGRVDVYADRATGTPLSVEMFARGARRPVLTTSFSAVTFGEPDTDALVFSPPHDAHVRFDQVVDLASAADRFASRVPPKRLGGLASRGTLHGSVGVYGRGPTVLLAVPLWSRTARRVRDDLERQPGVRDLDQGLVVGAPPMRLMLSNPEPSDAAWLVAGTVTRATLVRAAARLEAHPPGLSLP
jgi:hypothetical protein